MLYIVTGATGHLGYNIVRTLLLNQESVRVLVLPNEKPNRLENLNVDIVYGDVTDHDSLYPLFDLTHTPYTYQDVMVIHAAGIISISNKSNTLMEKVNVLGTKNMLDLSMTYDVKQFIYISSVHAIPERPNHEMITEVNDFDPNLVVGSYAKTKAIASKMVMDAYLKGFPITIIHPSGIIGPNDYKKGFMTQMIEMYLNKQLSTRVNGQYDFVDVRDVAEATYLLSKNHHLGAYILSGHLITLKKLFLILKKISGRKRKTAVVAIWFVKLFTPLLQRLSIMLKKPPLFTNYSLYTLKSNSNFSNQKASHTINYQPRDIEVTLKDTALWLIDENRLRKTKIKYFILKKTNL